LFPKDRVLALVLSSHNFSSTEGISKEKLLKEAHFLSKLFWLEFVTKP
jgi:hypothetical protein